MDGGTVEVIVGRVEGDAVFVYVGLADGPLLGFAEGSLVGFTEGEGDVGAAVGAYGQATWHTDPLH